MFAFPMVNSQGMLDHVRLQITTGRYRTKHGQAIHTKFMEEFVLPTQVRLQITSGGYRTKHGQAIRTEFIEEFVLPDWTCSMYANRSMNSVRIT